MKTKTDIPIKDLHEEVNTPIPFHIHHYRSLKEINEQHLKSAHRHDFFVLALVRDGRGKQSIDFVTVDGLESNLVFLIRPNQVHYMNNVEKLNAMIIVFKKEFMLSSDFPVLDDAENINYIRLSKKNFEFLFDIAKQILKEYKSENRWKTNIIQSNLNSILIHLSRYYLNQKGKNEESTEDNRLAFKFKKLVNEKFIEMHQVSDYAGLLFVTPGHLNDSVKKELSKSAKSIISERIILEAKRLLYYDEDAIKEISFKLKFDDTAYFSRFFKLNTKVSPQEFRDNIRKKYK